MTIQIHIPGNFEIVFMNLFCGKIFQPVSKSEFLASLKTKNLFYTDIFSLTKIICHRNFGNEFALTHSKDYLYYLAPSPLSQIFDNNNSPQN